MGKQTVKGPTKAFMLIKSLKGYLVSKSRWTTWTTNKHLHNYKYKPSSVWLLLKLRWNYGTCFVGGMQICTDHLEWINGISSHQEHKHNHQFKRRFKGGV